MMHSGGLESHENSEFRFWISEFVKYFHEELSYVPVINQN